MAATTHSSDKPASTLLGRSFDERGLRSRPRRRGLLAFAALMILGSGVAVAILVDRAGDTREVLAAKHGLAPGQTIARGDLVTKHVAGVDETFTPADVASVLGTTAVVGVVPGQVLTSAMVTKSPTPGPGESMVGLNLAPSRAPSAGLEPGDLVTVIAVQAGDTGSDSAQLDAPPVLASGARVHDVKGSATEGGGVLVTLLVKESAATRIAAYSTADRVAIVETAARSELGGS